MPNIVRGIFPQATNEFILAGVPLRPDNYFKGFTEVERLRMAGLE